MIINLLRFKSISQLFKADIINVLLIFAVWVTMVILVNPLGDFPLNDDWAYGRAVQSVVEKGDFQLSGWTATNLFSQVFWGALFCLPFGFSFTALRFSTLTLGLIGILSTYGLLRELNQNYKISLLGALLVAINPIYFGLSNTFMNDIPFFGFATLSLYFLLRGLKYDSTVVVIIGVLFSFVTILARQIGLAIPVAFGCAYLIKKEVNIQNGIKGFLPTLLGISIQLYYQKWLQLSSNLPNSYGNQIKTLLEELHKGLGNAVSNFTQITLFSLIYLGLFIFPFLIVLYSRKIEELSFRNRNLLLSVSSVFFVIVMKLLVSQNKIMPLVGNVLVDFGMGPVMLKDSELLKAPRKLWLIITAIGVVGAILLIQYVFFTIVKTFAQNQNYSFEEKNWLKVLIITAICIYFLPIAFLGLGPFGFYDRYLIFLLPLLMMLASVATTNNSNWNLGYGAISIALILMLLYGVFTIGATHDYLSWNRTRWQALHNLMQENQIPPNHINGGFEFNGWYLYDSKYKYKPERNWQWFDSDDYIVSFKLVTGYEEVKRYPFRRWLPWGEGNIFLLKKY